MTHDIEHWSEIDLLAGTIYGEASDQPTEGKVGVGLTVRTRATHPGWWGRNWRQVMLTPRQFCCWEDHNRQRIITASHKNDNTWLECKRLAEDIYTGRVTDYIGAPTHYCRFDAHPTWRNKLLFLCQIGDHVFYHDIAIDRS